MCLSLGVMVLCGYCNLAFAISFGAPLLGVSLILKLGMLLYGKWKKWKQKKDLFELSQENKDEYKEKRSAPVPQQDYSKEKNKGNSLNCM